MDNINVYMVYGFKKLSGFFTRVYLGQGDPPCVDKFEPCPEVGQQNFDAILDSGSFELVIFTRDCHVACKAPKDGPIFLWKSPI